MVRYKLINLTHSGIWPALHTRALWAIQRRLFVYMLLCQSVIFCNTDTCWFDPLNLQYRSLEALDICEDRVHIFLPPLNPILSEVAAQIISPMDRSVGAKKQPELVEEKERPCNQSATWHQQRGVEGTRKRRIGYPKKKKEEEEEKNWWLSRRQATHPFCVELATKAFLLLLCKTLKAAEIACLSIRTVLFYIACVRRMVLLCFVNRNSRILYTQLGCISVQDIPVGS